MKHMNRRILAAALAAVMVLGLLPTAFASAEEPEEQTPVQEVAQPAAQAAGAGSEVSTQADNAITTWADLQTAFNVGGDIVLGANITADVDGGDTCLTVPADKTVTLDLAGHTIDRGLAGTDGVEFGSVIIVRGTLTVNDSSAEETGKITGGNEGAPRASQGNTGNGVLVFDGGHFTLNAGSISGNKNSSWNDTWSGGVMVYGGGTFIMNGGCISDNVGSMTGGVFGYDSPENNTDIWKPFTIRLLGGMIRGNTVDTRTSTDAKGGGASIWQYGTDCEFTVGGNIVIQDNKREYSGTSGIRNISFYRIVPSPSSAKPLTPGARIGIVRPGTADGILIATAQDGDAAKFWQNFFADNDSYKIGLKSGDGEADKLYIATADSTAVHEPYHVEIVPGGHMAVDGDSALTDQWLRVGEAMKPITFVADEGCFFPADYDTESAVPGLTVERVDDTHITVSGTPEGDVNASPLSASAPAVFTDGQGNVLNPADYVKGKTPNENGDIFDGWFDENGNELTDVANAQPDTTYTAHWKTPDPKFTDGNGNILDPADYIKGETTDKNGNIFDGWFDENGNELTDVTKAKAGVTYTARWKAPDPKFTDGNGNTLNPADYIKGETVNENGDIFDGWVDKDGNRLDSLNNAKAGVTYTARWKAPDPKFTDGNGNTLNPADYIKGETTDKSGNIFDGWFDENGNELTDVANARNGVTYTARWKAPDKATDTVKTGDEGVTLYIGLASAALLSGGAAVLFANRKRREE